MYSPLPLSHGSYGENTEASVFIAAGLPLTWVREQKAEFKKYLLQHSDVEFSFRNTDYRIKIVGAEIYPQGFAAVAENLGDFKGVNMLCDIGNGTMNLLRIVNKKPDAQRMFAEKYGTHQCALLIREQMMKHYHTIIDVSSTRIFVPPQRDMSIWHSFPLTETVVRYEH